jgi:DMSO/TMAO reductase YedYZ molybdopterin-dependent catalytic subunit
MFSFEGPDRRKEEDRIRSEGRLPPGQALTLKFPVLHYGPVPSFNPASWNFRIWGEVEQEVSWTWDEFNRLPRSEIKMDIHCVTRWSKADTVWEGVSVRTLVDNGLIRIKPSATHVMQHAEYGFTVNLPLEVVLQDNFLMATHLNGEPITPDHGYPLRGVVGFIPGRADLETPDLG